MTSSPARPTSFDNLCERLADEHEAMPKRLSQTASYLMSHPDEVAFGTTASIAEAAGVQPSTLIRFSKAIGFDGFSELQLLFRERLRDRNQSYEGRLARLEQGSSPDSSRVILSGFLAAGQESLSALERNLNFDEFARAVDLLGRAGTIYLVARRRAFPPLIQLRYAFAKLGVRSEICGSINGIDEDLLAFGGPEDAGIAISFDPYSSQTVDAVQQMQRQGMPFVAISDSPLSPLYAGAAAKLLLAEADFAGFRTSAAAMTLVMALSVMIAERKREGV